MVRPFFEAITSTAVKDVDVDLLLATSPPRFFLHQKPSILVPLAQISHKQDFQRNPLRA